MSCKHDPFLNSTYDKQDLEHIELEETIFRIKESVNKLENKTNTDLTREVENLTSSIAQAAETVHRELETCMNEIGQNIDEITEQFDTEFTVVNDRLDNAVTELHSTVNTAEDRVNARVNNIIANSNSTEGNSELVDIRIAVDGTVYNSAGSSVREQLGNLKKQIDSVFQKFFHVYNLLEVGCTMNHVNFQYGNASNGSGRIIPGTKQIVIFPVIPNTTYFFTQLSSIYYNIALYNEDMAFISTLYDYHNNHGNWNMEWFIPETCHYIAVVIDEEYKDTAYFGLLSNYSKWSDGYQYDTEKIQKFSPPNKNHKLSTYSESLASPNKLELNVSDIKQNYTFSFTAKIPDTFSSVKLGHGINALYSGMYVEVTNREVRFYRYHSSDILVNTFTHGLDIQDFINVTVNILQDQSSEVIMTTLSGSFKCSNKWQGSKGTIAAEAMDCTLSDCSLSYYCPDYDKKIWAFGDSYFYEYSSDRWPKIVIDNGFTGAMFDGYGGRTSVQALQSLNKCLSFGQPDTILWCMGMNDPDTNNSVNTNWKNTFDTLCSLCDEYKIRLVVCTIPTTPTCNHRYKNDIVRNSGLEYIDIENTLGVDENGNRYEGLLSGDNIHPTANGSKAIAAKMMAALPEMFG